MFSFRGLGKLGPKWSMASMAEGGGGWLQGSSRGSWPFVIWAAIFSLPPPTKVAPIFYLCLTTWCLINEASIEYCIAQLKGIKYKWKRSGGKKGMNCVGKLRGNSLDLSQAKRIQFTRLNKWDIRFRFIRFRFEQMVPVKVGSFSWIKADWKCWRTMCSSIRYNIFS